MPSARDAGKVEGMKRLLVLVFLVSACGSASDPPTPTPAPTPVPTPVPWSLSATATYPETVVLGDQIEIVVKVSNHGKVANPTTRVKVDGNGDKADRIGCAPTCTVQLLGFLDMPGVLPGGSSTFKIGYQTTKLGVIQWSVCVFDPDADIGCSEGSTTVSG